MHLANAIIDLASEHLEAHPADRDLHAHRERIARSASPGDGLSYWASYAMAAFRQPKCGRFNIGSDVLLAAHEVMASKPASAVAALHRVRTPHPFTWLEWAVDGEPRPGRLGWLVVERDGVALAYPFMRGRGENVEMSAFAVEITWGAEVKPSDLAAVPAHVLDIQAPAGAKGGFSPADIAALSIFTERVRVIPMDEFGRLRPERWGAMNAAKPESAMRRIVRARELVALLLLLNSRNAVHLGEEADLSKLNRARGKRNRPSLIPLRPVTLDLSRRLRAAKRSGAPLTEAEVRAHIVRGHFKVRASGVFWWSAHARGGMAAAPRDYTVKGVPGVG